MQSRTGPGELDVYELAYLAGGLPRLVDTAVVGMVETGRVRVHAPGQLSVSEPTRRHPVEAAVLDAIGTHGHRSVDTVRWRLAGDERIAAVRTRLVDEGLLRRAGWSLPRRPQERAPRRTGAGVRALRRLTESPPADPAADGGTAVLVALHGREALTDRHLHESVFGPRPTPLAPAARTTRRGQRDAGDGDPQRAAARQRAALGGAAFIGLGDVGGDGGGF